MVLENLPPAYLHGGRQFAVGDCEVAVPSQPLAQTSNSQRAVELLTDNPDSLVLAPLPSSRFKNGWTWFLAALMLGLGVWIVVLGLSFISSLQLAGMMIELLGME